MTVPLVVKLAPAVLALSIVPDADTVALTVPRETVDVEAWPCAVSSPSPRVTMYAPTPMATRTATRARLMTTLLDPFSFMPRCWRGWL